MSHASLIPLRTYDKIQVKRLMAAIEEKRNQIAEMTLALEDLKLETHRFEQEYSVRVGRFYVELDQVNLSAKEYHLRLRLLREGISPTEIEDRVEACFRSDRKRLGGREKDKAKDQQDLEKANHVQTLPEEQMKQLRKCYLKLAKTYHPDKGTDGGEREKRKRMMTLINQAYEDGDMQTLQRLSTEAVLDTDVADEPLHDKRHRLLQELNRIMRVSGELCLEINRVKSSRPYRFKQEVEHAHDSGIDLLAKLARNVQRKINAGSRQLTNLADRFALFSKKLA